jgi:putative aldouronate transport system permease protein
MGMNAQNIILLRNAFEGVPSEIEEAARIDGATEFQILTKVYIPMSKATIATVALFFGISRWNGYFWAYKVLGTNQDYSWPVQVYMRDFIDKNTTLTKVSRGDDWEIEDVSEATTYLYAMVVFAMIPILVIYPFIQKYFAKGVNMGGVKE